MRIVYAIPLPSLPYHNLEWEGRIYEDTEFETSD